MLENNAIMAAMGRHAPFKEDVRHTFADYGPEQYPNSDITDAETIAENVLADAIDKLALDRNFTVFMEENKMKIKLTQRTNAHRVEVHDGLPNVALEVDINVLEYNRVIPTIYYVTDRDINNAIAKKDADVLNIFILFTLPLLAQDDLTEDKLEGSFFPIVTVR
jgi:hypothetical protein